MLFGISVLYGIFGIIAAFVTMHSLMKNRYITIFNCVRLMYVFIYGVIPCIIFYLESQDENNLYNTFSSDEIGIILLCYFSSTFGFFTFTLIYNILIKKSYKIEMTEELKNKGDRDYSYILKVGIACMVLGWLAMYIWTKAFGSLSSFIENASAIRSSRVKTVNRWAFMKYIASILPISMYAIFCSFLHLKPKGIKRIIHLGLIAVAAIGALYYFLASDSRVTIAFVSIALVIIYIRNHDGMEFGKLIPRIFIILGIGLILTASADRFSSYFRYGVVRARTDSIIHAIVKEFRFTISSQMTSVRVFMEGSQKYKILDDIVNAVVAWLPESRLPFPLPDTIWKYNTLCISNGSPAATSPTELYGAAVYSVGIIGLFLIPILYAWFTTIADNILYKHRNSLHSDIFYATTACYFINSVSHYQLSSLVGRFFPLFLYVVVAWVIRKLRRIGK